MAEARIDKWMWAVRISKHVQLPQKPVKGTNQYEWLICKSSPND